MSRHGKLSIHYAADLETIETIFRKIVSANQVSLYGTIAEMCEEYETLRERSEGVQGVLTLFCSGAAQVCHDDREVELKEQLEVEEEDGDRQEEKVEVEREKRVKEVRP